MGEVQVGVGMFENCIEFFEFGLEEVLGGGVCQEVAEVGRGDLVVVEVHGIIIPHFWGDLKSGGFRCPIGSSPGGGCGRRVLGRGRGCIVR